MKIPNKVRKTRKSTSTEILKIGLDLHGVVDAKPKLFSILTKLLTKAGHEVHIISGRAGKTELDFLKKFQIAYTHFFSITDHHVKNGAEVIWDKKGNPHLDPYHWDKTKGDYCAKQGIDLHIDDSDIYSYFFKTPFARFMSKDTDRVKKIHH